MTDGVLSREEGARHLSLETSEWWVVFSTVLSTKGVRN
jgi:hypothetical protein